MVASSKRILKTKTISPCKLATYLMVRKVEFFARASANNSPDLSVKPVLLRLKDSR